MPAIQSMWLSAAALILFTISSPTRLNATPTGPFFNPATGHNYYLLDNSNWTDAQAQALTLGGNLVTVNDAAENAWLISEFSDYNGVARNLWIGLNAIGLDGGNASNYSWVSGETAAYRNWASGEPNFSDQRVYIIGSVGSPAFGKWDNTSDALTTGYNQFPQLPNYGVAEVVPEPASYLLVLFGGLLFCRCRSRRSATRNQI